MFRAMIAEKLGDDISLVCFFNGVFTGFLGVSHIPLDFTAMSETPLFASFNGVFIRCISGVREFPASDFSFTEVGDDCPATGSFDCTDKL